MHETELFSVRMHSQRLLRHHSGAERLCRPEQVGDISAQLVQRAMQHSRGAADAIRVQVDRIDPHQLQSARLLPVRTQETVSVADARSKAVQLLAHTGVPVTQAQQAVHWIAQGADGQGNAMRGALLVDFATGNRCEPDPQRGVRVSRMDVLPEHQVRYRQQLADRGFQTQTQEALILASKVASAPGVLAELCWSDDPDYTTGYVASSSLGYVRLPSLKSEGDERGGRALFVQTEPAGRDRLIAYLEQTPVVMSLEPVAGEGDGSY